MRREEGYAQPVEGRVETRYVDNRVEGRVENRVIENRGGSGVGASYTYAGSTSYPATYTTNTAYVPAASSTYQTTGYVTGGSGVRQGSGTGYVTGGSGVKTYENTTYVRP